MTDFDMSNFMRKLGKAVPGQKFHDIHIIELQPPSRSESATIIDTLSSLLNMFIPQEKIDKVAKELQEVVEKASKKIWDENMGGFAKDSGLEHVVTINLCLSLDRMVRDAIREDINKDDAKSE